MLKKWFEYYSVQSIIFVYFFILAYLAPRFATFVKYGKSELTPPTPGEIPQAIGQALKLVKSGTTFQFRHLTVKVHVTISFHTAGLES